MDLDLRKVRYFVAVADHENFGRAAQALHIAQPVLSRQIRALEQELKVRLFDRDTRGTRLTAAGEALLDDARTLLPAAEAAWRRARTAAADRNTFTVGFPHGVMITAAVREFSRRHREVSVEVYQADWRNQADVIRDGRVDVGYLRLPVDQRGLAVEQLYSEPCVVVLRADHPLAGKEAVSVTDLAAEHLLQDPASVPQWRDVAVELRGRRSRPALPQIRTFEEKLEHIAAGTGINILPQSAASSYTRADIAHVLISDVPAARVALAWDSSRRSALVHDYVAIAVADHQGPA